MVEHASKDNQAEKRESPGINAERSEGESHNSGQSSGPKAAPECGRARLEADSSAPPQTGNGEIATEVRLHHPYSPSQLQNLEVCPCYVGREGEVHERAIAGTIAHTVTDAREDDTRLSDDDAGAVHECLEFFDRRANLLHDAREREQQRRNDEAAAAGKTEFDDAAPVKELKEVYLPVDDLPLAGYPNWNTTTGGYVDTALFSWDMTRAEIIDWKFGAWAVEEAENNLQGIAYALGLFKEFPSVAEVTIHFFQPHIRLITSCTFYRKDVARLYLRVQVVVAKALIGRAEAGYGNFARANPMIPACNFCGWLGHCPKVSAMALNVGKKYAPLEIPDDVTPSLLHNSRDANLGMRLTGLVKAWAEAYRRQLTNRVLEGRADMPDGHKAQQGCSAREVIDLPKFKSIVLRYLTQEEFDSTVSVTLGAIEKLIMEKTPRGGKETAVKEFGAKLLDAKAVKPGNPFTFLKAISKKSS